MAKKRGNNEGTVYKRPNGSWRAQLALNGGRLSFSSKSKKEALEWMRNTANQMDRGLSLSATKIRFGDFLMDWVTSRKTQITPHTLRTYYQLIRDYIGPALGGERLQLITPAQIQGFYNAKVDEGLGLRTIQKTHTVMHAALNYGVKLGYINSNPAKGVQVPKPRTREMEYLNEVQVRKLLEVANATKDRNYALYFIAIATGMREGELLGLRWENVDLDKGILNIKFSLSRIPGGGLKLTSPKTKASIRTLKLGQASVRVLQDQRKFLAQEMARSNGHWQDSRHVFPSTIGTAMDPSNLIKQFHQLLKRAELPKMRFHDLRHTAASMMLNNHVEVLAVSQRLGHAKPSITLDVYGHLMTSKQNEAADVMDNLIVST